MLSFHSIFPIGSSTTKWRTEYTKKKETIIMRERGGDRMGEGAFTSRNQSYSEKKRGLPNRSVTAPSATGMVPTLPPLRKLVSRLLALSSRFRCFGLGGGCCCCSLSTLVDWHLRRRPRGTNRSIGQSVY